MYDVVVEFKRSEMEIGMLLEIFLIAGIGVVLYGLISSTEKVLLVRNDHIKIDERMTDHRSRL